MVLWIESVFALLIGDTLIAGILFLIGIRILKQPVLVETRTRIERNDGDFVRIIVVSFVFFSR